MRSRSWTTGPTAILMALIIGLLAGPSAFGQTPSNSVVPTLVNFSGILTDADGKPLTTMTGVTFYLYKDSEGGAPLWLETQNVQPDRFGHYTVMLGSATSQGLPSNFFISGEARWLGVQAQGQAEQPRVLLLSVPYALKAGDAQTVGGLPASAFVLAAHPANPTGNNPPASGSSSNSANTAPVGGTGSAGYLAAWTDNNGDLGNSALFQKGTGSAAKIGIGTTSPAATLDVKGAILSRGALELPSAGTANGSQGFNSQPIDLQASSFNSGTLKAVSQLFQWQAEPVGNSSTNPSGSLNLLFGANGAAPSETGLAIDHTGLFTFAKGQTFPGAGTITGITTAAGSGLIGGGTTGTLTLSLLNTCSINQTLQWNGSAWVCATAAGGGTITGVTAGTDLTGGGTTGNVTLNLDTTKIPQLNAANIFTADQVINANGGNTALNVNQEAASGVTYAIIGTSHVPTNGDAAILGQEFGTAEVFGVQGYIANQTGTGAGVFGSNAGTGQIGGTYKGFGAGVWGDAGTQGTIGVFGSADNGNGVVSYNNSSLFASIVGENQNAGSGSGSLAPGVYGISYAGDGLGIIGSGPVHSNTFNTNVGHNPIGVVGDSSAPTGIGVWGTTDIGTAVFGQTTNGVGIAGSSLAGTGVYGLTGNSNAGFQEFGVWGDDNTVVSSNVGVYGSSTNGMAILGVSSSQAVNGTSVDTTATFLSTGSDTTSPFYAGTPDGDGCLIQTDPGKIYCTGDLSSLVPVAENRFVELHAVEATENWFEDFGSSQLKNGTAVVELEPTFAHTVNASTEYHVFPVPNGDCKGLYVSRKTATSFVIRELSGGKSNVSFDYRIVVRRKGYENGRLEDVTEMRAKVVQRGAQIAESAKRAAKRAHVPTSAASVASLAAAQP